MNSVLRLFTVRQLITTSLLIAAVIGAVVVWVHRGAPVVTALDNLSGGSVHALVMQQYDDQSPGICGAAAVSDVEAVRVVDHGLDSTSDVPAEVVAELDLYGANLEDHEQRHFDTHRLLLISWDPTSQNLGEEYGEELGSVYELHYLEDENSVGWAVVYSATVYECRPEDLAE